MVPVVSCPKCRKRYDPGMDEELKALQGGPGNLSLKVVCPACGQWLRLPEREAIPSPNVPPDILRSMMAQSRLLDRPDAPAIAAENPRHAIATGPSTLPPTVTWSTSRDVPVLEPAQPAVPPLDVRPYASKRLSGYLPWVVLGGGLVSAAFCLCTGIGFYFLLRPSTRSVPFTMVSAAPRDDP